MTVYCSFFFSLMACNVCTPFCSVDGSAFLFLTLVNSFTCFHAVLLSKWQRIAHSSARLWLSRFAHYFAQWMTARCSFFCSLMAFTVCTPFCSVDGSTFLFLTLINSLHSLRAVLLSGWQQITHSSACQQLSQRFTCPVAQQMAVAYLFSCSSTTFTVCVPFLSVGKSTLLLLLLINGFHNGFRAMLPSRWQPIAHSSACQRLS